MKGGKEKESTKRLHELHALPAEVSKRSVMSWIRPSRTSSLGLERPSYLSCTTSLKRLSDAMYQCPVALV